MIRRAAALLVLAAACGGEKLPVVPIRPDSGRFAEDVGHRVSRADGGNDTDELGRVVLDAGFLPDTGARDTGPRDTGVVAIPDLGLRDAGAPPADATPGADASQPRDAGGTAADATPGLDAVGARDATVSRDAAAPDASRPDGGGPLDVDPLAYPARSAYRIKGLQPDFWSNAAEIAGANAGGVAMNLVWSAWEPARRAPPCAAGQAAFDGRCYAIEAQTDAAIRDWTARGLIVTAVVYGVPAWARTQRRCTPAAAGYEIFCAPDDAADFGRFAGFLAERYDGRHGNGRIADFVIHNEVNSNDWFDIGCGQGTPCDTAAWIATYAESWNAAYDRVRAAQPEAKVLVSLDHHFGSTFDAPAATNPLLSGQTFLLGLAPYLGTRELRVAFHPYPPDLRAATFGADDFPKVTFGNVGVLAGWLRATFPGSPSAWEVQLTEAGISSRPPSSPAAQSTALCEAFRNVLGTPGIESFVYHRMVDHPTEVAQGLALGLRDAQGVAKPAWNTWQFANRNDLTPPRLSCGFEDLPYIRLVRGFHAQRGHWISSRATPAGFTPESAGWRLLRDPAPGTVLLFECRAGGHNFLTPDVSCEGQQPMGPVGYAWAAAGTAGTAPLYRCRRPDGQDHLATLDPGCEGYESEGTLGWVLP